MPNCANVNDDSNDPSTKPSPLLVRKLLGSVIVKAIAAADEVIKLQKSWFVKKGDGLGLIKMIATMLIIPSTVPLSKVSSESSGEHVSDEVLGTLEAGFSGCDDVCQEVEGVVDLLFCEEAFVEGAVDNFGLDDGKGGGRRKTDNPRAR